MPPTPEHHPPATPPPRRPDSVANACYLVLGSFLVSLLTLVPPIRPLRPEDEQFPWQVTLLLVVAFGALTFWLASKTFRGKNWARWALLLYLVFGWLLGLTQLPEDFQYAPMAAFIGVVCIAMEVFAAWSLFLGTGASWFRQLAAAKKLRAAGEA